MPDPRVELAAIWRALQRAMHDHMKRTFKDFDFPPIGLMLLRHIGTEPGVTIGELSRRSGTVKSHVSKQVDQLVAQGLVEKRADPEDQRLVRLFPTAQAEANKAMLQAKAEEAWLSIINRIPPDELDDVIRGFRALLTALNATGETPSRE
jgi:DNA-binding MarR family transcriptional regulator